MNKRDLIQSTAEETGVSKAKAGEVIDHLVTEIGNALAGGEKVVLHGLGTWETRGRKARKGRNPQTGQAIEIPAKKAVNFKPSEKLKQQVNA